MRLLVGGHQIGPSVAVEIADRDILDRADDVSVSDRGQHPGVGIGAAEGDAQVVRILVHRDDIEKAVAVDIGHLQAIAATDRHAC